MNAWMLAGQIIENFAILLMALLLIHAIRVLERYRLWKREPKLSQICPTLFDLEAVEPEDELARQLASAVEVDSAE